MKIERKITGGRISFSDMREWLGVLAEPPQELTDEESREFINIHLESKILDCII